MELIEIYHPKVDGSSFVTQEAFDNCWSQQGWQLVPEDGHEDDVDESGQEEEIDG